MIISDEAIADVARVSKMYKDGVLNSDGLERAQPTLGNIRAFIKRVTYKPGWEFGVNEIPRGFEFFINRSEPNAYDPSSIVSLHTTNVLDRTAASFGEDTWFGFLKQLIQETEFHEMDEWLRFDNNMCYDPHS